MARRRDVVDSACEEWAIAVRKWLNPRTAREQIGPPKCTLGATRDLHHGSRSQRLDQHWPEFPFHERDALVNGVFKRVSVQLQRVLVAHYVVTSPRSRALRAEMMGVRLEDYWQWLDEAKHEISKALA